MQSAQSGLVVILLLPRFWLRNEVKVPGKWVEIRAGDCVHQEGGRGEWGVGGRLQMPASRNQME
ncbi:hypothetical protein E2C01_004594 [Portunus trituberculatus]|uniref:Uncharacterized protein n=1 Tax=Portunus trituberculatus TaxID=210409 RepID=A0A5B7CQY0_PORTR|nr:hypothetical protein [Portunus trituberculatus]